MNTMQLQKIPQSLSTLRKKSTVAAFALFVVSMGTNWVPIGDTAGLQGPEPGASAVALTAADAFDLLKRLNERGEIIPSFQGTKFTYRGLEKKNCFGFRLPGGARIVGESSGRDYWVIELTSGGVAAVQIGILYSESDLVVGTAALPKGSYSVMLAPDMLTLRGRELNSTNLPLPSRISDSILSSKKPPRFSLAQDAEGIFLVVEGNRLLLQPKRSPKSSGLRGPGFGFGYRYKTVSVSRREIARTRVQHKISTTSRAAKTALASKSNFLSVQEVASHVWREHR